MSNKKKTTNNKQLNIFGDIVLPAYSDEHWRLNSDKTDPEIIKYNGNLNIIIEAANESRSIYTIFVDGFELSSSIQAFEFTEQIIHHHIKRHIETDGKVTVKKPTPVLQLVPTNE